MNGATRRAGPGLLLLVALLLCLEAALVGSWWRSRAEDGPATAAVADVPLGGDFARRLESGGEFRVRLVLRLDLEGRRDPGRLVAEVERRIPTLRAAVATEVLGRRRDEDLARATAPDSVGQDARRRINRELGDQLGERELVREVLVEGGRSR